MKQKLTLLILAITTVGAWAAEGSITLTKSNVEFLRNYSDYILDINYTSRNATRFASTTSPLVSVNNGGGNIGVSSFLLHASGSYTIQMLPNYTITKYTITVTPNKDRTFTPTGGSADITSLTGGTEATITVSDVNDNSCSFAFTGNASGNDGYNTISQIVIYYSYTTATTMVQTMADLSYADCSSCPTYTITCQRSSLYVDENGTNLTTAHAVVNPTEARKKFAFIKNTSTDKYYLYNVSEGKFVNQDKSLANSPTNAVELHFTLNYSYPQYVRVGSNYMNVQESGSTSGGIVLNTYVTQDGGNCFTIEPSGTADLTRAHKIVNGWTATYHIDGTALTATGNLTYNGALSLPGTLKRAYCTYKYYSDAECENEITTANDIYDDIYVKYGYTGPFAFSTEGESPEYVYYLLRTYNNNFLYSSGSSIAVTTESNTGDAYQWAIVGNPYAYTLKNKSTGTYLMASYSSNGEATLGATGTSFGLYTNTQAPVTNHFTAVTTNGNNLVIPQNHPNAGSGIRCYNGTGAEFTDVTGLNNLAGAFFIPFAVVTYNLIWNESTIQSTTKGSIIGTASEDEVPWTVPAFSSFAYDVATIGKNTSVVNVTLNWDGPFVFSNSFNDATWYNLKINGDYLIYASAGNYTLDSSISNAESAGYDAFWGFMGNPVDGVQIINKSAGEGKTLAPFSPPTMFGGTYSWAITEWKGDFLLHWSFNYLNNVNGEFKLYNSATTPDDPVNTICSVESASYRGLALDFIDDYADSHALGHYFGVSTSTYNSVRATYADAASVSESDYTTLVSNVGAMLPASYPGTGYYRIKSNSGRYIGYGQPEADPTPSVGLRTVSAEDAAKDASTIIHLVEGVGSRQYTMSTEGLNVQSMMTGNTPFPATSDAGAVFTFAALAETPGKGTICNPASNDEENEHINGYLHEANWSVPGVVNWEAGVAPSQWEIEAAESLTVLLNDGGDGYKYATLCLPFAVTLNEACAYTLTLNDSQTGLRLSDAISAVPAGTPVLLRSASASVTASIAGDASYATTPVTSTDLTGVYVDTAVASDTEVDGTTDYFLGIVSGKIGFYHWAGTTLKANRAYFDSSRLPVPVKGLVLDFEDDATSIQAIDNGRQTTDAAIYNIAGQRLNKMQKGINIVNGKKVLK